jgi:hypothetical protein
VSHTVKDFTIDEEYTTLPFVGRYFQDYAEAIAESMLWLTEKFSSEAPPANAIRGQIWFNRNDDSLYYFNHPDTTDSSEISNWAPFVSSVSADINSHINNLNNPHLVTKQTLGLSNVENVFVYNKNLNFAEYINGTLSTSDLAAAQTNLDSYPKAQQYPATTVVSTFFPINGTANNSLNLAGIPASGYMTVSTPTSTSGITNSSTTESNIISVAGGSQSIHFLDSQGGDLSILSGIGSDFRTVVPNDGGIRFALQTKQTAPTATVTLYAQGAAGGSPTTAGTLAFTSTNVSVNGNNVFHEGNLPTPGQISALPIGGTAQNAFSVNGKIQTTNGTQNQIALRDSLGVVVGSTVSSTSTSEGNAVGSSGTLLFRNSSSDSIVRHATKSDVQTWINANSFLTGAKHWAVWSVSGGILTVINSYNCSVTKQITGQYKVTLLNSIPTSINYCVIAKIDDDKVVGGTDTTLDSLEVGVDRSQQTTTSTVIHSSLIQGIKVANGSGGYTAQFRSVYTDATLYSVGIFY